MCVSCDPYESPSGCNSYHDKPIGVNISEQKSRTEPTKKRELVLFTPPGGATSTVVHRLDAKRILPELR